jgi:hypothetical protein
MTTRQNCIHMLRSTKNGGNGAGGVLSNRHVYPPVRTFERASCERDMILAVATGGT